MKSKMTLLCLLFVNALSMSAQTWKTYPYVPTGGSLISFPVDEGRHNAEPVEWWYTSGHITTATKKEYSFMLTYFFYPVSYSIFNFDGFRILNVTDESTGIFYQDTQPLNYTTMSTTGLNIGTILASGPEYFRNSVDGSSNPLPFQYEVSASSSNINLSMNLTTTKRPLIIAGDGYFDQGLSNYTYYYSQTDNTVSGSLTVNGTTENITGTAWIDRQYGDFNPFIGENYEWFSLKLSNGYDINLWDIFTAANTIPDDPKYKIMATYVDESAQYTISDFEIERLEYFKTPDNLKSYAKKWRLTSASKNMDLIITANHSTSEVNITQLNFRFFEGSITVSGMVNGIAVTGKGFAELLHSYADPDVSITNPIGGFYDVSVPITWTLNNPDDGRPVTYDIEYSNDDKATFNSIATGLTTNSYTWDGTGISNGDAVWFKVKSYSIDNTLNYEVISSSSSVATLSLNAFDSNKIKFYPNPVTNELTLEFQNGLMDVSVEIYDLNGRLIITELLYEASVKKVNTQYLSDGFYFLQVKGAGFKQVFKILKK